MERYSLMIARFGCWYIDDVSPRHLNGKGWLGLSLAGSACLHMLFQHLLLLKVFRKNFTN